MLVRACGFWQGQYEEAGRVNGQAIEIMERAKGPDNPDLAFILNNKATLLREQVRACFILSFPLLLPLSMKKCIVFVFRQVT